MAGRRRRRRRDGGRRCRCGMRLPSFHTAAILQMRLLILVSASKLLVAFSGSSHQRWRRWTMLRHAACRPSTPPPPGRCIRADEFNYGFQNREDASSKLFWSGSCEGHLMVGCRAVCWKESSGAGHRVPCEASLCTRRGTFYAYCLCTAYAYCMRHTASCRGCAGAGGGPCSLERLQGSRACAAHRRRPGPSLHKDERI